MRVLLTGGSGLIGRHLPGLLRARGYEVHSLGRSPAHGHRADLLDPAAVEAVLEGVSPTHLLHLAWHVEPGFRDAPENLEWFDATMRLVRRFAELGGARAVLAGTCFEVFGPPTLYSTCKAGLARMVAALGAEFGLSTAWGRVFFLHGPGERVGRLVPSIARALLAGEPAPCSHGRQVRDYLHAADVAAAFAALLDSQARGVVDVGSGEAVTIATLAETIAELTGRPELLRLGALEASAGEPERIVADVARLREEVGFAPALTLRDGLAESVAYWRGELSAAAAAPAA